MFSRNTLLLGASRSRGIYLELVGILQNLKNQSEMDKFVSFSPSIVKTPELENLMLSKSLNIVSAQSGNRVVLSDS